MDKLSELPPKQSILTQQENDVMDEMFGPAAAPAEAGGRFANIKWKLLGATTLLFVVLANPWIDSLICKVPYCESPMFALAIKVVLFFVILIALNMFL